LSKICPICKLDNDDSATECESCGETFVKKASYVWKIRCPACGSEYDVKDENSVIKTCEFCEDEIDKYKIEESVPYKVLVENAEPAESKEPTQLVLIMTEIKSGKAIKISGNCVIGRRGDIEPEYFAEDKYISEYHCKVILENDVFKIEHLPTATNPTKIDKNTLSKGVRNIIRDGEYLTIADKTFEISIQSEAK